MEDVTVNVDCRPLPISIQIHYNYNCPPLSYNPSHAHWLNHQENILSLLLKLKWQKIFRKSFFSFSIFLGGISKINSFIMAKCLRFSNDYVGNLFKIDCRQDNTFSGTNLKCKTNPLSLIRAACSDWGCFWGERAILKPIPFHLDAGTLDTPSLEIICRRVQFFSFSSCFQLILLSSIRSCDFRISTFQLSFTWSNSTQLNVYLISYLAIQYLVINFHCVYIPPNNITLFWNFLNRFLLYQKTFSSIQIIVSNLPIFF